MGTPKLLGLIQEYTDKNPNELFKYNVFLSIFIELQFFSK